MHRRDFLKTAALFGAAVARDNAFAADAEAANRKELNALGPEGENLASRTGLCDLTETIWPTAGTKPQTSTGLVAERFMMGAVLQEIIRPVNDTDRQDVRRTDLLTFNRVEGRWQYVSFDTRDPVGLMPA